MRLLACQKLGMPVLAPVIEDKNTGAIVAAGRVARLHRDTLSVVTKSGGDHRLKRLPASEIHPGGNLLCARCTSKRFHLTEQPDKIFASLRSGSHGCKLHIADSASGLTSDACMAGRKPCEFLVIPHKYGVA